MPPETQEQSPTNPGTDAPTGYDNGIAVNEDDYGTLGEWAAFDASPEPFAELSDTAKKILHELIIIASRTDVASRRFEVEQAWESRLFERGYQHLLPRRGGGWSLPGEGGKWAPLATADSSALYATNIFGRDKDIITAAIAREIPAIEFFPVCPTNAQDVLAAEGANKYKDIYVKHNKLRQRLMELAYFYYTDDRAVLYTRHVLDGQRFGFATQSVGEDGGEGGGRVPNGTELTSVYGKLEAKVPMQVREQSQMHFIQLYEELDVMTARAKYPWVADKLKAGSCGIGEIELDRIARINANLALLGSYVTGDAMERNVTQQMTWFRPSAFFDEVVSEEVRKEFLDAFPDGALVVYAGTEFCFARNESMDDHLVVSHAMPGNGQNRRSLGNSNIPIQKRLNNYYDLLDAFMRCTVPRKHYDANAFDVNALQNQDNQPGSSGPFLRQPGVPTSELIFVEPTPQPQPALPQLTSDYFSSIPESLTGANNSLFGGTVEGTGGNKPVGTAIIERDAALARIGVPWNMAKDAFNEACRQAVMCAAVNRTDTIDETGIDGSKIELDPATLKGRVQCYPEYDTSFPESWAERESRYTEIVVNAAQNPFYAKCLESPKNILAMEQNVKMAALEIPGATSVKKQMIELEVLTTSAPVPNPQVVQMEQALQQAEVGIQQDMAIGKPIPPEAAQMIQQIQQQMQSLPPLVSSVPVAQDESENHSIEAETCWEWLNGEQGIKFKTGLAEQQAAFQNVLLHWSEHEAANKKLNPPPTPQVVPHISFAGKDLSPTAQTQALAKAGINEPPENVAQNKLVATQHKIAERVVPKTVPESINVKKITRDHQANMAKADAMKKSGNKLFGGE